MNTLSASRARNDRTVPFLRNTPCVDVLAGFSPISLSEMDSVKLMNRTDTKYLTDTLTLESILSDAVTAGYRILEMDGAKVHPYDSVYFDTDALGMFVDHRRGKLVRQKVRTRKYLASGQCFLEVKRKNNHGRTKKKRVKLPDSDFENFSGNEGACGWLRFNSDYDACRLSPSLETAFDRITLVDKSMTERLTIDSSVSFINFRTDSSASLGSAVIIELKQDARLRSEMKSILLAHRVKPVRISKYCIGISMTDSSAVCGRFKQKMMIVNRINKNSYLKCYRPLILQPL